MRKMHMLHEHTNVEADEDIELAVQQNKRPRNGGVCVVTSETITTSVTT